MESQVEPGVQLKERMWDYTTLDMYLRCKRKYYWRIVRDLEHMTTSPALDFGKTVHASLEAYYKNKRSLPEAMKVWDSYITKEGDELRTQANGQKLMEWYDKVYQHCPLEILQVEIGFAVPVYNPTEFCVKCSKQLEMHKENCPNCNYPRSIMYCGRIDGLAKWDGQLFALEHKTTSVMGYSYFEQFRPNMQIDGYTYAASQLLQEPCAGAIVNALEPWKEVKRVTEKTKKPEDHFARKPIMRSAEELKDFALEVNQLVCEILQAEEKQVYYKTKSACFQYNYSCPYKQLCLYGDDERLIKKDYNVSKWEPYKQLENEGV